MSLKLLLPLDNGKFKEVSFPEKEMKRLKEVEALRKFLPLLNKKK